MSECKYCGGDCPDQVGKNGEPRYEYICDEFSADTDELYKDNDND